METLMMAGTPGPWQILIVVLAVLILFGSKKIPEFARSLAKGLKEFKKATKEVDDSIDSDEQ